MPGAGLARPLAMLDLRRDQVQDPDVQRHPLPVAKGRRWGWAWRSGQSGHLNPRSMWKLPLRLAGPGDLQALHFLERLGPDEWGYYGLARTGANASPLTG